MVSTPKHDDKMPIQSQPQNKNAGVAKEITVKLDDHSEVSVTITVEAFELSSLDAWIRSRFGLPQVMKLRYLTEKGKGESARSLLHFILYSTIHASFFFTL